MDPVSVEPVHSRFVERDALSVEVAVQCLPRAGRQFWRHPAAPDDRHGALAAVTGQAVVEAARQLRAGDPGTDDNKVRGVAAGDPILESAAQIEQQPHWLHPVQMRMLTGQA